MEHIAFQMHPKLLYDIICRQAGTLSKAILEGVMNSGDAEATECRITVTNNQVIIVDNGRGIKEREQIEKWFATFGQPHTEEEKKKWGAFRMGRGQMFAFGVNTWKTGTFRIAVDFKDCSEGQAGFDLFEGQTAYEGCCIRIILYEKLLPSELAETERTLRQWCKYTPFNVYLNDSLISTDPETLEWDYTLPEAYIKLQKTGELSIYNLGVHTMDMSNRRFGTGGNVVSRKQLKVNFARNDVQSDCPVWKKVKPLIDQYATARNLKSKSLDEGSRKRLVDQALRCELPWVDFCEQRVLTAVNGRQYSPRQVSESSYKYGNRISAAPKGHPLGDKLFQQKVAFILADETLERFEIESVNQLVNLLKVISPKYGPDMLYELTPCNFHELTAGMTSDYLLLDKEDLRPNELVWLRLIETYKYNLRLDGEDFEYKTDVQENSPCGRRMCIGHSDQADGWTDGSTFVAIARSFLAKQNFNTMGIHNVGNLLLHEFCHDNLDTAEHEHGVEFYQLFHDSSESIGRFVSEAMANMDSILQAEGRKLNKQCLRWLDQISRVTEAEREFDVTKASNAAITKLKDQHGV